MEKIGDYMEKYGLSLPVAYDEGMKVSSSFDAKAPTNIIIDVNGTILYKKASPPADIEGYLKELLGDSN